MEDAGGLDLVSWSKMCSQLNKSKSKVATGSSKIDAKTPLMPQWLELLTSDLLIMAVRSLKRFDNIFWDSVASSRTRERWAAMLHCLSVPSKSYQSGHSTAKDIFGDHLELQWI